MKKSVPITLSKILQAVAVPVFDVNGKPREKIFPVWQGETFIPINECDQVGLPKGTIKELVKSGKLTKYYFNGIKKLDNRKTPVYVKLSEIRNLYSD